MEKGGIIVKLEEKVFERKKFIIKNLLDYGFRYKNGHYTLKVDFMEGDFQAILAINEEGVFTGKVIDKMNNEAYGQLYNETMKGAYVNSVRFAYENLLTCLAKACCVDVHFAFHQANRITAEIVNSYHISPDFPWVQSQYQDYGTFRHPDSKKWFALIMNVKWGVLLKNEDETTIDIINLKIDPEDGETLRKIRGIYPGYHMNHKYWISVVLNDTLLDEKILRLVEDSFSLTKKK